MTEHTALRNKLLYRTDSMEIYLGKWVVAGPISHLPDEWLNTLGNPQGSR